MYSLSVFLAFFVSLLAQCHSTIVGALLTRLPVPVLVTAHGLLLGWFLVAPLDRVFLGLAPILLLVGWLATFLQGLVIFIGSLPSYASPVSVGLRLRSRRSWTVLVERLVQLGIACSWIWVWLSLYAALGLDSFVEDLCFAYFEATFPALIWILSRDTVPRLSSWLVRRDEMPDKEGKSGNYSTTSSSTQTPTQSSLSTGTQTLSGSDAPSTDDHDHDQAQSQPTFVSTSAQTSSQSGPAPSPPSLTFVLRTVADLPPSAVPVVSRGTQDIDAAVDAAYHDEEERLVSERAGLLQLVEQFDLLLAAVDGYVSREALRIGSTIPEEEVGVVTVAEELNEGATELSEGQSFPLVVSSPMAAEEPLCGEGSPVVSLPLPPPSMAAQEPERPFAGSSNGESSPEPAAQHTVATAEEVCVSESSPEPIASQPVLEALHHGPVFVGKEDSWSEGDTAAAENPHQDIAAPGSVFVGGSPSCTATSEVKDLSLPQPTTEAQPSFSSAPAEEMDTDLYGDDVPLQSRPMIPGFGWVSAGGQVRQAPSVSFSTALVTEQHSSDVASVQTPWSLGAAVVMEAPAVCPPTESSLGGLSCNEPPTPFSQPLATEAPNPPPSVQFPEQMDLTGDFGVPVLPSPPCPDPEEDVDMLDADVPARQPTPNGQPQEFAGHLVSQQLSSPPAPQRIFVDDMMMSQFTADFANLRLQDPPPTSPIAPVPDSAALDNLVAGDDSDSEIEEGGKSQHGETLETGNVATGPEQASPEGQPATENSHPVEPLGRFPSHQEGEFVGASSGAAEEDTEVSDWEDVDISTTPRAMFGEGSGPLQTETQQPIVDSFDVEEDDLDAEMMKIIDDAIREEQERKARQAESERERANLSLLAQWTAAQDLEPSASNTSVSPSHEVDQSQSAASGQQQPNSSISETNTKSDPPVPSPAPVFQFGRTTTPQEYGENLVETLNTVDEIAARPRARAVGRRNRLNAVAEAGPQAPQPTHEPNPPSTAAPSSSSLQPSRTSGDDGSRASTVAEIAARRILRPRTRRAAASLTTTQEPTASGSVVPPMSEDPEPTSSSAGGRALSGDGEDAGVGKKVDGLAREEAEDPAVESDAGDSDMDSLFGLSHSEASDDDAPIRAPATVSAPQRPEEAHQRNSRGGQRQPPQQPLVLVLPPGAVEASRQAESQRQARAQSPGADSAREEVEGMDVSPSPSPSAPATPSQSQSTSSTPNNARGSSSRRGALHRGLFRASARPTPTRAAQVTQDGGAGRHSTPSRTTQPSNLLDMQTAMQLMERQKAERRQGGMKGADEE